MGQQHLTEDRMLDPLRTLDTLKRRVLQEVVRRERPVDRYEDIFRDGRGQHEPAELPVVRRQIGATAAEGDPERRAGDDHVWSASGARATAAICQPTGKSSRFCLNPVSKKRVAARSILDGVVPGARPSTSAMSRRPRAMTASLQILKKGKPERTTRSP